MGSVLDACRRSPHHAARLRYLFALKRTAHGDLSGCWLISGLERVW
ncbi:MAG: hypothetical protein WD273_14990 [Trueperaceae bacterium]